MSRESEHFVRRWSRLKRTSADAGSRRPLAEPENAAVPRTNEALPASDPLRAGNADAAAEPDVDLASLPSIESITAGTDIRAFLQSGVPAELTKAALRRAWSADPAIRDFIGIAENQWDFTDPNGIPGFGPFEATESAEALVNRALGKVSGPAREDDIAGAAPASGSAAPEGSEPTPCASAKVARDDEQTADPVDLIGDADLVAPQQPRSSKVSVERQLLGNRRSHGRAVPR